MGKKSPLFYACKWEIKCVEFSVTEIYINSDFLNDSSVLQVIHRAS